MWNFKKIYIFVIPKIRLYYLIFKDLNNLIFQKTYLINKIIKQNKLYLYYYYLIISIRLT